MGCYLGICKSVSLLPFGLQMAIVLTSWFYANETLFFVWLRKTIVKGGFLHPLVALVLTSLTAVRGSCSGRCSGEVCSWECTLVLLFSVAAAWAFSLVLCLLDVFRTPLGPVQLQ